MNKKAKNALKQKHKRKIKVRFAEMPKQTAMQRALCKKDRPQPFHHKKVIKAPRAIQTK